MICSYRPLKLKFATQCSACGKELQRGRLAYRDEQQAKIICASCERQVARGLEPSMSPAQLLVDEARRLMNLPAAQAQFDAIVMQMRRDYPGERVVRQFVKELHGLDREGSLIATSLRYDGRCFGCASSLSVGTLAAWDRKTHRIWCLECASA